jgi:hypothetical protein
MANLNKIFRKPSSSTLLVIAIKPDAECRFRAATMTFNKKLLKKSLMFLKMYYHTELKNPVQVMRVAYNSDVSAIVMLILLILGNKKYRSGLQL